MKVIGYKCFNKDLTNQYGKQFSVGKIYIASGGLKFGNDGNGFHMCKNIEDTFRYFNTQNNNFCVCKVIGTGSVIEYSDEYNGYYDMYCVERLKITKKIDRLELMEIGLKLPCDRMKRFISTLSLSSEEVKLFKSNFNNNQDILDTIAYYQENDKDVYNRKLKIKL